MTDGQSWLHETQQRMAAEDEAAYRQWERDHIGDANEKVGGLVYLACPYSHPDADVRQKRHDAVTQYAADLTAASVDGAVVYSPITYSCALLAYRPLPPGYTFWRKLDEAILRVCSRVVVLMLDGWRESEGVAAEIELARRLGLPVEFVEVKERTTNQGVI